MLVARCGGSGTGAHLTAQRMKEAWSDRGAGRTSFCPCSYPHRLSASASWPSISYPHRLSARPLDACFPPLHLLFPIRCRWVEEVREEGPNLVGYSAEDERWTERNLEDHVVSWLCFSLR